MKRKRIILGLVVAAVTLVVCIGGYFLYWSYHPHISLSDGMPAPKTERYSERVMVVISEHREIPTAASVEAELMRLSDWNNLVDTELRGCAGPQDVRVSGEREGGEITLRYEGFVTTKKGETVPYLREETFRLFVREKDFKL